MLFAWIVLLVTGWFLYRVGRRAIAGRARHNLFWALSLAMAFIGTAAYLGAVYGSQPWAFRVYYLLGAMLMAAYMGLGSLWLEWGQSRPRWAAAATWAVTAAGVAGAAFLFASPLESARLAGLAGDPGTGIISSGGTAGTLWLVDTILLNSFGVVALVGVAAASAWRAYTTVGPAGLARGNAGIALGGILLGLAGSAARLGLPGAFWLVMALGWVVIYAGFEAVSRAHAVLAAVAQPNDAHPY